MARAGDAAMALRRLLKSGLVLAVLLAATLPAALAQGGAAAGSSAAAAQGSPVQAAQARAQLPSAAQPSSAPGGRKKFPVRPEDIVLAYPADDRHIVVAKASRIWRKGLMRTFIANNHQPSPELVAEGALHNETWSTYPDDNPRRSLYPGDSRAGLVPFLAHKHFGDTYKWLLYMDDDTIFFPDAVMRLLEDFDPDMPYFITDHLWWPDPRTPGRSSHPNKAAPRCLPCHFNMTPYEGQEMPFPAPIGCPCTPELLCEAAANASLPIFNRFCDMPRAPVTTYSMHGGAGGIMSIGLMREVSFDFMERCTKSLYSTGGDAFISICLWQAGYAMTDPGLGLFHPDLQYFDPGPEDRVGAMLKLSQYIDNTATKQCDALCELQLEHMVSLHVRSRMFNTLEDAASFIRGVSIMYEVYADIRNSKMAAEAAAAAAAAAVASASSSSSSAAAGGAAAAAAGAKPAAGAGVKAEEAVQATATAAAAAVAAAATANAKGVGPDGRPLSQEELKQKELAASLAEDAAKHQDDHRNETAMLQDRERQEKKKAAVEAEKAKFLLKTQAAASGSGSSHEGTSVGAGASAGAAAGGIRLAATEAVTAEQVASSSSAALSRAGGTAASAGTASAAGSPGSSSGSSSSSSSPALDPAGASEGAVSASRKMAIQ